MLGSDFIGNGNRARNILANDDFAVLVNRSACNLFSLEQGKLRFNLGADRLRERLAVGNQDCACKLVVLRLREQIRCQMLRVAAAVGDD